MAKVIMGIGIPGSGKTTALRSFAEKYSYAYICPDDIRAELGGNAAVQSTNREVWEESRKRTSEALSRGETVVFDATFAKEYERKDFIRFVRERGAEKVQGVFADVSLETAHERNSQRERVVPAHAIERMYTQLEQNPPVIEDGFDSVFQINELQQLVHAEMHDREQHREVTNSEFKKFR